MKGLLILAFICGAAYLFYDLQSVKLAVNETLRAGTFKGVENCVAYSESNLMSADATRSICISKFQKMLFDPDLASGRAGPKFDSGRVNLGGSLENRTTDFVTTWIEFSFTVYDSEGVKKEVFAETFIWIEPRSSVDFSVELPNLTADDLQTAVFCDHDDTTPKSCMGWGIARLKGVEI